MHELAQARVELTLLEEKARGLLKQLLDVRATIATQRAKIDELSRTNLRSSTINRLPTEILVFILDLDIQAHHDPGRKQDLAGVCQRWRDVILQTPYFWTTIYVASDASSTMAHLERSRGALLDIVIESVPFSLSKHLALLPGLDIVMACAHRWRSLLVADSSYSSDDNLEEKDDEMLPHIVADRINHLHFPSLKSVTISSLCDIGYLLFLSIARAPALEYLELGEFMTVRDILSPVAILKTLKLNGEAYSFINPRSVWSLVPSQGLTKLTLSWATFHSLQPNSLHMPSLMSLEMYGISETRPFLDAIVAPNLEQFDYFSCYNDPPSVTFSGFSFKFTNVRQLSFSHHRRLGIPELLDGDAVSLCEAFPSVRHVELHGDDWPYLFDPPPIRFEPGPSSYIRYPMDLWTELESLTFNGLHSKWLELNQLMAWLVHRLASSLQQLHVKVKGTCHSEVIRGIDQRSIRLYERLKESCILELDGFSKMDFTSMTRDSSSKGVSSFHIQLAVTTQPIWIQHSQGLTRLLDEIAAAFLVGDVSHSWA